MDEAIRHLLQTAMYLSPTGVEQVAFSEMVQTMRGAGEPHMNIVKALLDGMSDGVKHGNWPKVQV